MKLSPEEEKLINAIRKTSDTPAHVASYYTDGLQQHADALPSSAPSKIAILKRIQVFKQLME